MPRFNSARRLRVVLASGSLVSHVSAWRAAARALAELGCPALFAGGIVWALVGPSAPWFVLAAVVLGLLVRAVDVEARALVIPGGLYGSVRDTLGRLPGHVAAAALLIDRLVLGSLAAVLAGRYLAAFGAVVLGVEPPAEIAGTTAPVYLAVALLGPIWVMQRQGRSISDRLVSQAVGVGVALLALISVAGAIVSVGRGDLMPPLPLLAWSLPVAFGYALVALGGVEALGEAAVDLQQPRILNLERAARLVGAFSLLVTVVLAFLFVALVPPAEMQSWAATPVAAVAHRLGGPGWLRQLMFGAAVVAAAVLLAATARSSAAGAQRVLGRLVDEGLLGRALRTPHPRFGTPSRLIDITIAAQAVIVFVSSAQVSWLARVYAVAVMVTTLLKTVALVRLRSKRPEPRAFAVPPILHIAGRSWPIGLFAVALLVAVPLVALLVALDPASLAGVALLAVLTGVLLASERTTSTARVTTGSELDEFNLLPSNETDLAQVNARPGNILVPVRKPHVITHLAAALRTAGNRDVVAVTVRLVGVDVADEHASGGITDDERFLLSAVAAQAERAGRSVRLLVVPGVNIFDALIETALRLESSEIHVGESETLSADDQARLLGDAWERAPKTVASDLRLVIHHPSGRTAAYHIGAHAPNLQLDDLAHIHRVWLDVVRTVGPHVHHRDVVRAAITLMENELHGPNADAALRVIREAARPADELAAALRQRDFGRLREMLRNRPEPEIASLLADLPSEDQVVVFRILPRRSAATTFEYLTPESQNALLKAMASEDVAALLNDMAPDDRTMFLEELPAAATRQLLGLLTPEERAVAVQLLGYPEGSIGRLMTPQYVAVREDWTVAQVLDHIREHGQDSETMNVIYVVDDRGLLIDDIRIRNILLAAPSKTVREIMDRRYIALKATDDQETAVRVFRAEDRSALPVTDSAGMLIGIVTVDDVLDVAEAEATEDIQRLGGSEALDEPYMTIRFSRMVQKRAGWLTALFIGEMLTATAMGFFEHEIERAVILALFVPLIISSGGNSGSQASSLVIRALALGEVTLSDWWRVMRREIGAGLALGAILGTVGFLRISVWSAFSTIYGEHWLLVAVTVAFALLGVVLWGTLIGSLLPLLLRRLGFDPAASSAPFVATLVDVTGLVIYFSVAIVVLGGTLL